MNRFAIVMMSLGLLLTAGYAQVDSLWLRHYQFAASYPYQYMYNGRVMSVDPSGNVIACAYGYYDADNLDFLVMKYDSVGNLVWSRKYDGGSHDYAFAMTTDEQGALYVTGRSYYSGRYTMATVKWSAAGQPLWSSHLSGDISSSSNAGYSLVVDRGAVYVVGQLATAAAGMNAALVKLSSSSGAEIWRRTISRSSGNGHYERGIDAVVDSAGAVYVSAVTYYGSNGYDLTMAKYDGSGNLAWQYDYNSAAGADEYGARMCLTGELVVSTGYVLGSGGADVLTVACTRNGASSWAVTYNGPGGGYDYGRDIGSDRSGNVFVTGMASGTTNYDMVTLKYTPSGSLSWSRLHDGGSGHDYAYCLDVDAYGNVIIGGRADRGRPGDTYLSVLQYAGDGTLAWKYGFPQLSCPGSHCAYDLVSRGAEVAVAGMTYWPYPCYTDPTLLKLREVPDVGVQAILVPYDTTYLSAPLAPRVQLRNYGLLPASFDCRIEVSDGYRGDTSLTLGPGVSQAVDFAQWAPGCHGNWAVDCYTRLGLDYDRSNDTLSKLTYTPGPAVDVGVTGLVKPDGNIRYQTVLIPTARWKNHGVAAADVRVYMTIGRDGTPIYRDSMTLSGMPANGRDSTIRFAPWIADQIGVFAVRCSTAVSGDGQRSNDTIGFQFGVVNEPIGTWTQLADVPILPSGRPVYQGGGLAGSDEVLYALKGNKSNDVHVYGIASGSWADITPVPEGSAGKPVKKGGKIVADQNGRLYVVKGNGTFEFYVYDPAVGWRALADVPPGPRNKAPKGGTGLEYAVVSDTGYIYLLKGINTAEFYRYHIVRDTWEQLPDAPAGRSGKLKYKYGSALCAGEVPDLYCMKGKYNEIFRFNMQTGGWSSGQLPDLPFYGASRRKKKVKQGGDLCWAEGYLSALKGGNTKEFWRLEPADSTWYEYPEVPYGAGKAKRVKYGAGLEFVNGSFYVLKGNKTQEFWRFDLAAAGAGGVMAFDPVVPGSRIAGIYPNPVSGRALVQLAAIPAGRLTFVVFDAGGRRVMVDSRRTGRDRVLLDFGNLQPGVYFLRADDGSGAAVRQTGSKLVIAR